MVLPTSGSITKETEMSTYITTVQAFYVHSFCVCIVKVYGSLNPLITYLPCWEVRRTKCCQFSFRRGAPSWTLPESVSVVVRWQCGRKKNVSKSTAWKSKVMANLSPGAGPHKGWNNNNAGEVLHEGVDSMRMKNYWNIGEPLQERVAAQRDESRKMQLNVCPGD